MVKERGTKLWELGVSSIRALETDEGILASGKEELYGCVFGRDSLITSLSLLKVYEKTHDEYFLSLVKKVLRTLAKLQGYEVVIESGEEPGKIIHEYRPTGHEHLTQALEERWYLYPDNVMRNYDSVDSTPLFLMVCYEYLRVSQDQAFIDELRPNIDAALRWLTTYGDSNGDGFIDYRFHPDRKGGGLRTQSWMDSTESVFNEDNDERPQYPIAPIEVQAYAYVALRAWGKEERAQRLKEQFNEHFVYRKGRHLQFAYAIDGKGNKLGSMRSSVGHTLFATFKGESILDAEFVPQLVKRLLARDLFVPTAGIRTLSSRSKKYDPMSYHNGTIWPHDTQLIAEGLHNFGYHKEAQMVQTGLLDAYSHFDSPVELFAYKRGLKEYESASGQKACKTQAWSAASLLAALLDAAIDTVINYEKN
ncbi:hypothetical protein KW798_00365 [Candidatus Parcubacteria bacterium]|nr:hypothetical protein [Candidatus Parcubacteria bacterium]